MNKEDKFWSFLVFALLGLNKQRTSYYDAVNDTVFSLLVENQKILPCYFNENVCGDVNTLEKFNNYINQVKAKNSAIIELPGLIYDEKRKFILNWISEENNSKLNLINEKLNPGDIEKNRYYFLS